MCHFFNILKYGSTKSVYDVLRFGADVICRSFREIITHMREKEKERYAGGKTGLTI